MTANQTINGVPREAFKWAMEQLEEDGNKGCGYFDSLRALLDAPIPFPGYPPVPEDRKLPAVQYREVDGEHCQNPECCAWIDPNSECTQCKPAAQRQGDTPDDDKSHPRFIAGYTAGLHDHNLGQPQGEPVAWLAQAIGNDGEVYRNTASPSEITLRDVGFAWGQGVIDRFKIVIKPLYAEQPAPVAVSPTCCGSCPGGCTIGNKP